MRNYIFELPFEVRDYECDLQGIVNNAVYQNYFEHTRHKFLLSKNISFSELHKKGIDAVVVKVEISFKHSLLPDTPFISKLSLKKEGVRYVFHQALFSIDNQTLFASARTETVILNQGKLGFTPELDAIVQEAETLS
ncbi:acyl-CoA thioesterase [Microbacter margulisiae]|uniref:Acyl-CoA thioester hydrolase n=1 Tax=Microbacter margulisiae TaxID=1350067 RepID=A0A7W5DR38_9PORP|nr:acyl-CoA thioesterase [Microbacter margulisiae]MBB3187426.1 acyl-CoA thioester hydrolase [Microbacter margulisiae]